MNRLAALLFGLLFPLLAVATPRIILLDYQTAEGDRIELGEVALLEEWPQDEEAKLDQLDLGHAPGPGQTQLLKSVFIKQNVYKALGRTAGFEFVAEPFHRVLGRGTMFASDRMVEEASRFVLDDTGWQQNEVAITTVHAPQDLCLPPGDYQLSVRRLSADYYGATAIKVSALENGVEKGFRTVQFNIARRVPALVAARTLAPGETVGAGDVETRRVPLPMAAYETRLCKSPQDTAGKKLRRVVAAGSPLLLEDLESPMLIKRGDEVAVWVKSGLVTIKTRGEAVKNGRAGDRIPVQAHGKNVWGQVVGRNLVVTEVQ